MKQNNNQSCADIWIGNLDTSKHGHGKFRRSTN